MVFKNGIVCINFVREHNWLKSIISLHVLYTVLCTFDVVHMRRIWWTICFRILPVMLLLITVCLIKGYIRILTVRTVTQIVKSEKKIAQNIKERRYKEIQKSMGTKGQAWWLKRIAIVGFEKLFLYSLTVFQFFFFVTFNIMLRRHIC